MQSSRRRSGLDIEDDALKTRCLNDLDPALPLDRRVAAVNEVAKHIPSYSTSTMLELWTVTEDLTRETATLEARKAGFTLLKASVSHSGVAPQERDRLFRMIITPAHPSIVSLQISALEDLTKHGTILQPFEAELIKFINSSLDTLFWASQDARKIHSEKKANAAKLGERTPKAPDSRVANQDDSTRGPGEDVAQSKVGEERGLIGAFYFITDIITHNPTVFDNVQLELLIDRIAFIARQTTSRKTLNGVVRILQAATTYIQLPLQEVAPCLRVLFKIYKTPNISFEPDLEKCLSNLLQPETQVAMKDNLVGILMGSRRDSGVNRTSAEGETLLHRLIDCIFTDPPKSEASCGAAIKAFSNLFAEVRLDTANKIMFEEHLRELCTKLDKEQELRSSTSNALADVAAVCGPDISNKTFSVLLDLIEMKSGISSSDSSTAAKITDGMADCLIRLFLRCTPESASKTSRVYKLLLLAAAPAKTTIVRLSVIKLLARLRCDSEQAIEVVSIPDTQGLAGTLCRTEATAASVASIPSQTNRESMQEQPPSIRQGRSSGAVALSD